MSQLTWSLVTGQFAHSHTEDDPRSVTSGTSHFHGSAPFGHRHLNHGAPAEIYDRLGTARWLLACEVKQILWEMGLLENEDMLPASRVV